MRGSFATPEIPVMQETAAPAAETGVETAVAENVLQSFEFWQYSLVSNVFSFTIATMGAAALFFFLARRDVAPKYRSALMYSGLVVTIACYHYFRIYESWGLAYEAAQGEDPTEHLFNDAYRYVDWLLTVPLLLVELVAVLNLPKEKGRSLLGKLVPLAVLMIILGYPGEISRDTNQGIYYAFWALSMLPFLAILAILFTEFTKAKDDQPEPVKPLVDAARFIIVVTWSFYPVAYLLSNFLPEVVGEMAMQIGYAISDVVAKAGYGLFIYYIARTKSEHDGYYEAIEKAPAAAEV